MVNTHNSPLYRRNRSIMRRRCADNHIPCHYCGQPFDFHAHWWEPLAFTVDHVIPVNAGGSDRMENLVPAHFKCNRAKGDNLATPIVRGRVKVAQTTRWW